MKSLDDQSAEVDYPDGTAAMSITASPAHDATGASVRTSLSVADSIVTLHVYYKELSAQGHAYVFPIVSGAGYEVGYSSVSIEYEAPEAEEEENEATEETPGVWRRSIATFGAPERYRDPGAPPDSDAYPSRAYRFNSCREHFAGVHVEGGSGAGKDRYEPSGASRQCHSEGTNAGEVVIDWAVAMYGRFWYHWKVNVWIKKDPQCLEWGPYKPAYKGCYVQHDAREAVFPNTLNLFSQWRFKSGQYACGECDGAQEVCFELRGILPTRPKPSENGERVYFENRHEYKEAIGYNGTKPCNWGHLTQKVR
jgi:hypothetical protein